MGWLRGESIGDRRPENEQRRPDSSEFAKNGDRTLKKRLYRGAYE
jgi:hypothetical protein